MFAKYKGPRNVCLGTELYPVYRAFTPRHRDRRVERRRTVARTRWRRSHEAPVRDTRTHTLANCRRGIPDPFFPSCRACGIGKLLLRQVTANACARPDCCVVARWEGMASMSLASQIPVISTDLELSLVSSGDSDSTARRRVTTVWDPARGRSRSPPASRSWIRTALKTPPNAGEDVRARCEPRDDLLDLVFSFARVIGTSRCCQIQCGAISRTAVIGPTLPPDLRRRGTRASRATSMRS